MHNLPVTGIRGINNPRYFYILKRISEILPSEKKSKFGKNYRVCELDHFKSCLIFKMDKHVPPES